MEGRGKYLRVQFIGARTSALPTVIVDANDAPLATSIDFELPDHYLNDIVMEMAQLVGINLRDSFVSAAAQGEQTERKQESTF